MSVISEASNKKGSYKSHIVPSVVTAALALSAAIPITAALASNAGSVSADTAPIAVTKTADNACNGTANTGTSTSTTGGRGAVEGASTQVVDHYVYPSVNGNNNGTGNNNGNGGGQGNGNGNGSGANANGNTQTALGGLIGGVNAIVPVSALNGTLNGVASGNTVSVPVLSNNDGNTTNVPVLNNVLNTVTDLL